MGVPEEAIQRILPGTDNPEQPEDLKVGSLLKYSHGWFSTLGSMGICARGQINRFYNASLCAELYEAVTGIDTGRADLRRRVDRVWTLYKMANVREGAGPENEAIPDQWIGAAGFKNYVTGKPLTRVDIESMVEDYYAEWGWDRKTGVPTAQVLQKLGLDIRFL
jgi:aldehyde:ferredoxin oxidoreductase